MAVNVSPVQIHQGGLVAMLDRVLEESGFNARRLDLELTERATMRGISALPTPQALKRREVTLTLDDFGSGYSSFSRLAHLPIDAVKIDRSLIEHVIEPGGDVITRAIIVMARTLGLQIVAEGVETVDQLECVESERCNSVEGFLLSRPIAGDAVMRLLTTALVNSLSRRWVNIVRVV